jgi:hypothetical protein
MDSEGVTNTTRKGRRTVLEVRLALEPLSKSVSFEARCFQNSVTVDQVIWMPNSFDQLTHFPRVT